MFQNIYTAQGGNGMIAFASCFPGSIRAFNIRPGQEMIFQKSAFLASEAGVQLSVHFHKKVDYLEEKDLFFRKSVDRELHLRNLTDM